MAGSTSTSKAASRLTRSEPFVWRLPLDPSRGMRVEGRVFLSEALLPGALKDLSLDQVANVAMLPGILEASIAMPDIHQGYGFPIGGVAAMDPDTGVVSPGGVGFDINCGVRLLSTPLGATEVRRFLTELVGVLAADVPAGTGSKGPLTLSDTALDEVLRQGLEWAASEGYATREDLACCEEGGRMAGALPEKVSLAAKRRGQRQLGTLGAGNHFLEVQAVDEIFEPALAKAFGLRLGGVVVMIHTGSRGLGHQVATDYIRLMDSAMARANISLPDRQLACAPVRSPEGRDYLAAMACACNFAWCNRQLIAFRTREAFRKIFGPTNLPLVYDVAHNIAKFERHLVGGQEKLVLVHRKGATRAFPPHHRDLPESYRETGQPIFIPGDMGRYSFVLAGAPGAMERSFGSVCHGAGRVLSRTAARRRQNFYEIEADLKRQGIVARAASRSGITEEAPDAYKDVAEVVNVVEGAGLARRVARLRPLGVIKG